MKPEAIRIAVLAAPVMVWLAWPILRHPEQLGVIFQICVGLAGLALLPTFYNKFQRTLTYRGGFLVSVTPWRWVGIESRGVSFAGVGSLLKKVGVFIAVMMLFVGFLTTIAAAGCGSLCRFGKGEYSGTLERSADGRRTWLVNGTRRWLLEPHDMAMMDNAAGGPESSKGARFVVRGCAVGANLLLDSARVHE